MKRLFLSLALLLSLSSSAQTVDDYLEFLYGSMPLNDSIDYDRDYWRENVELAMRARREMPWGASVPEREFRHFVLPVRVNNENLDSARRVFYRELAPRVKGLSMHDAALEVNHWLHEKANYRPSDARTSSPLATVRTTWGRCGEESTLGVAAMRAVGIPARQVYTPRWAHTDDNHAWVEVWVDGRWHFLGACEPEPILDLAWFNAPAARGMLMATNAFGHYDGPEQKLYSDSCYTRINVTANYAPLRRARVKVVRPDGSPAAGAYVSFRLYNYAELYPLFVTQADSAGCAELLCGMGDLTAWASDGSGFGVVELPADVSDAVTLTLSPDGGLAQPLELTLTPPPGNAVIPRPTPAQAAENARRFAIEDSLRNLTMADFFNERTADDWVNTYAPDAADKGRIKAQLISSYGNHPVISGFLKANPDSAAAFLCQLSAKDLRDVTPEVLADMFTNRTSPVIPRVDNELLTPFCAFFDANVPADLAERWKARPELIPAWIAENIAPANGRNPNRYCISPAGVWKARMADDHSRDIFFVALCRWLGIPARINWVTGATEWGSPLTPVSLGGAASDLDLPSSTLNLTYDGEIPANPVYYTHFTLSRIVDGKPQLLSYDDNATLSYLNPFSLAPGEYLLTTGRRMADGSVMARLERIELQVGQTVDRPLTIADNPDEISVIGSFNADPLLPVTGRGFFVLAVIAPGHEPSTHLLNELRENRDALEKWGKKIVLLFASDQEMARFDRTKFPGLPSNVVFGVDPDGKYLEEMAEEFRFDEDKSSFPALIVADTFNRVVFHSTGYHVGLGERLSTLLPRLPE